MWNISDDALNGLTEMFSEQLIKAKHMIILLLQTSKALSWVNPNPGTLQRLHKGVIRA